ncbi:hypothetical protein PUN28_007067 [Cardiocondyla obscurior]|uniref:Uncharacterized protein n=1 Tax=Cardiocondyla obscurior TaxID=286306 RepID=A0AAW2G361_9HYME
MELPRSKACLTIAIRSTNSRARTAHVPRACNRSIVSPPILVKSRGKSRMKTAISQIHDRVTFSLFFSFPLLHHYRVFRNRARNRKSHSSKMIFYRREEEEKKKEKKKYRGGESARAEILSKRTASRGIGSFEKKK